MPIDDRSRYVLGWSNEAKIEALTKQAAGHLAQIKRVDETLKSINAELKQQRERANWLSQLSVYRDFNELDWRPLTVEIDRLAADRKALEAASDVLRTLQSQLTEVEQEIKAVEERLAEAQGKLATTKDKQGEADRLLADANTLLDATPEEGKALYFPKLEAMRAEALGDRALTVESCDNRQSEMREWLQARIDADGKRADRLRDSIIGAMQRYKSAWPVETSDVDANVDAARRV